MLKVDVLPNLSLELSPYKPIRDWSTGSQIRSPRIHTVLFCHLKNQLLIICLKIKLKFNIIHILYKILKKSCLYICLNINLSSIN